MSAQTESKPRTVKILVLEDSATQREQLVFLLEQAEYSVVAAPDGKQGLEAARAGEFDLVISDIVMPEMDGYEFCRELRTDPRLQHLPVVLLTSLADPRDVIRGLESGANNFICKPYEEWALLARVKNVLANQELRRTASSEMGINIFFAGQRFFITADRLQILDLLLSTYENAVNSNTELARARDELRELNERLEERVAQRTAALRAEIEERKRAELARREAEEAERHGRAIASAVAETTVDFLTHGEVQRTAKLVVQHAVRLTGATLGAFLDVDRKGQLRQRCVMKLDGQELRESEELLSFSMGDELLTEVVRTTTTAVTAIPAPHESRAGQLPPGHPGIANLMALPLISDGVVVGLLVLANHPAGFGEGERATAEALGNVATLAVRAVREMEDKNAVREQLYASQRLESVGRLAGGVAHDFNNLLTVILGCGEFALERVRDDDPLCADLRQIKAAGQRAAALTGQLLAFSRKQVLEPKRLNLNEVLAGLEKMLRRVIGEDIELDLALSKNLGATLADPGQIEQVVMNLVVNARDAMPDGGRLTIETANAELDAEVAAAHVGMRAGAYVLLSVTDNGSGMDEQTKAQIFEPFFTTKEVGKGTGLGLATVYGIVKQSGGSIWVYSEPGKGTTFKLYFPRTDQAATSAAMATLTPGRARGTETILVVEDEEALRSLTRRMLAAAGFTVLTAANGNEALEVAGRHDGELHLVLTDVVMPEMSGKAVAERLSVLRPGTKIVYMSGYTDNAIVHHGVLDRATHFVSKPFGAADLVQKLRRVLDEDSGLGTSSTD